MNKWWYHNSECVDTSPPRRRLNLTNLGGVFYILIVGLFISMFVAIIQFYWKSKKVAKKRRTPISVVLKEKARLSVTGEGLPIVPQYRDTKSALTPPSMRYTSSTTSTLEKKETLFLSEEDDDEEEEGNTVDIASLYSRTGTEV
ncbi:glutamate receptor 4-like [Anneissia japonica]|uniref:glutamate receptor 4-like n=1 Tax=Anneissia japonica TaxID=1529436 RepID=UPI001425B327|nr:glutamate receptor 4-like [Anneissia japonica]